MSKYITVTVYVVDKASLKSLCSLTRMCSLTRYITVTVFVDDKASLKSLCSLTRMCPLMPVFSY
jgi:hypothetical protein